MKKELIDKILENHKKWLEGSGYECANFKGVNLDNANFKGANLKYANFEGASLMRANFEDANLEQANFKRAYLTLAHLESANLKYANFASANLAASRLEDADLTGAWLVDTNLRNSNLKGACFVDANLIYTNFEGAYLKDAKSIPYIPLSCPPEGAFIGWKKAQGEIIKLLIPEDSKRLSATTRKCRCNKAYVVEIQDIDGNKLEKTKIRSNFDPFFVYRVGEIVEVEDFCEDRWEECASGIHFFVNRQDAVEYRC